ncbi:MAG TPA: hypothetical protein VEA37_02250 [Flavobacterium sp.]|nr:hypothetical protein [Flavobacterium sp.]
MAVTFEKAVSNIQNRKGKRQPGINGGSENSAPAGLAGNKTMMLAIAGGVVVLVPLAWWGYRKLSKPAVAAYQPLSVAQPSAVNTNLSRADAN